MSRFSPSSTVPLGRAAAGALAANEDRLDALQLSWPRIELAFSPAGSIYHGYPFLFLPAFPQAPLEKVATLALATRFLDDSLFVADAVMDGEYEGERLTRGTLQLQMLQLEAYALFHELFPRAAGFWTHFRRWMADYVDACHEERQLAAADVSWRFGDDAAKWMATGKCGLAKVAVAGLAELSEGRGPKAELCRSIDHYYVARQMVDDLSDWRVDLERGFPSLLLRRVLAGVYEGDRQAMAADRTRTARAIYFEGHADDTLHVGLRALDEAGRELAGLPPLPFHSLLRTLRGQYEDVFAEIAAARCRQSGSVGGSLSAPAVEDPWSEVAWRTLRILLPRPDEGATLSLLERSFRLEALAEADRWSADALGEVVAAECDQLLARRLRSAPGGWRFSGAAPGLPPDLWNVAQAGLALDAAGRRQEADGSFAVPALPGDPADGDPPGLWAMTGDLWRGPEADVVDVVAIATWLRLLDAREVTAPAAETAREWLIAQQGDDGAWRTSGSTGPLLPTCAAVQALAAAGPPESLDRAWRFLAEAQGRQGGWGGPEGAADARSTALGLLTLAVLEDRSPSPEGAERAARARRWLDESGLFEPSPGRRTTRLMTASFLLRAATRWSRTAAESATFERQAAVVA